MRVRHRPGGKDRRRLKRALVRSQGLVCHWCGSAIYEIVNGQRSPKDATLDHKLPISKGGRNTLANLVLACRECNEARGDKELGWAA